MPAYGQLGCRGFFVLDSELQVVSAATSAFMEVRQIAFRHVEALLDAICGGWALPKVCPGEFVELMAAPSGKAELLGQRGLCVKLEKQGEVVHVALPGGKTSLLPATSVRKIDAAEDDDMDEPSCSGGSCNAGSCNAGSCNAGSCNAGSCNAGSCNSGSSNASSCTPSGCTTCDGTLGLDADFSSLELVSVQVASMDAEHEQCVAVLRRLASERSEDALKAVAQCFSEHFSHEEALFEEFGFGAHENEKLSARKSHADDHRRILGKLQKASAPVSTALIRELLQDFHEHTTRYDVQYSSFLIEKGAK